MSDISLVSKVEDASCTKIALRLGDAVEIETAFSHPRWLCVSSQAGCGLACSFCETGRHGLRRNLSIDEIMAQVHTALCVSDGEFDPGTLPCPAPVVPRFAPLTGLPSLGLNSTQRQTLESMVASLLGGERSSGRADFDQISFSGMGEPLQNIRAVGAAMERLHRDTQSLLHLSTTGIVPRLADLFAVEAPFSLDLSLHATSDRVRSDLVPINEQYPIAEVIETLSTLVASRPIGITITYLLLAGANDTDEDLTRLIELLDGRGFGVELKGYNPIEGSPLRASPHEAFVRFASGLRNAGIYCQTMNNEGVLIQAGCGQLVWKREQPQAALIAPSDLNRSRTVAKGGRTASATAVPEDSVPSSAPERVLLLSLASACGCDCVFCGLPQSERHTVLDRRALVAAIEGHPRGQPWEELNLTGGEPLLVPEVRPLFSELGRLRDHFESVSLCTSGIPAKATLAGLRALVDAVGSIGLYVSLDGVKDVHDRARGRIGAFAEVEAFLAEAPSLVSKLTVHCVIHKGNVSELDSLTDYCNERGHPLVFGLANSSDHYISNQHKVGAMGLTSEDVGPIVEFFERRGITQYDRNILGTLAGTPRRQPCRLLQEGILLTSGGDVAVCGTSSSLKLGKLASVAPDGDWIAALARRDGVLSAARSACDTCTYTW
jgi:23S rRNA (adenine2503-C2)-methyltransferase